ncbi:peptide ABC transporter substrate-binding protein [Xylocopilactobacillus apicola]|uniref:Peptide ABC transporter substrate-binding protein n=1 Tax=Xylocopilactobacillus apicola TaxID=2932184 RepID=A0AAU9D659_9LACO|nr:peptide ABC transporter substrate-binding protein [Xylocopilactobacillus apicola]BDR59023.1 peptide ABC transporter substrate-binding protein [Xylocopilactobacillus apicola]
MDKRKCWRTVVCFLVLMLFLTGCQKKESKKQTAKTKDAQVWRVGAGDMLQSMDSSNFFDQNSMQAVNNVMEGLYRYRGKNIEPAMATKIVEPDASGLKYTFKLRQNALWSNGDPVTADNFVFAWQRTVDPKTKAQYAYLYSGIKNADAIRKGRLKPTALGIKKVDDHTFTVELERKIPYFTALMTNTPFFPQNQKIVKKYGKAYGTTAAKTVYNGPFSLTKWNGMSNSWTLVKNSKYWNQKQVYLDRIEYVVVKDPNTALNLFSNHQLDDIILSGEIAKQKKSDPNFNSRELTRTMYLTFNQGKNSALKNESIRKALSLAIDRKQLTKDILGDGSFPVHVLVPLGLANNPATKNDFSKPIDQSTASYSTYNLAKAKELWEQGKKETGIDQVTWTMLGEDNDSNKKLMEYFQGQLEKLPGLKINLQAVPHKTRLQFGQNGQFDLMTSQVAADFPDPVAILNVQTTNNVYNFGHTSNSRYDQLIEKSNLESDPNKRFTQMSQALEILSQNQEVAPIYQLVEAHLTRRNLKGVTFSPNHLFNYVGANLNGK